MKGRCIICLYLLAWPLALTKGAPAAPHSGEEHLLGTLQSTAALATQMKAAGVELAVLSISWDRFEPRRGIVNSEYVAEVREEFDAFRKAGLRVILDTGLQYPPSWLFQLPGSRYVDQRGRPFEDTSPGMNVPNGVFNAAVRDAMAGYLESVFAALGSDFFAVRLGGGWFGELNYPPHAYRDEKNCYWAFDDLAQGRRPGLPIGIKVCPVPGWKPGEPSEDHETARLFLDWYLGSLQNYHDWQIETVRGHYAGMLMMLYPSWGIRPGQINVAVAADLAGKTPAEANGEISRGFDFERFVAGIKDPNVAVHCTWLDSTFGDDTSDDAAKWTPGRFLASLARKHAPPLQVTAENTGGGDMVVLQRCADRVRHENIRIFLWAFQKDLVDGSPPELQDLGRMLSRAGR